MDLSRRLPWRLHARRLHEWRRLHERRLHECIGLRRRSLLLPSRRSTKTIHAKTEYTCSIVVLDESLDKSLRLTASAASFSSMSSGLRIRIRINGSAGGKLILVGDDTEIRTIEELKRRAASRLLTPDQRRDCAGIDFAY